MKTKWSEITAILRNSLESGVFRVWISPLKATLNGDKLVLHAPNAYMAEYIGLHFLRDIRQAAAQVSGISPDTLKVEIAAGQESGSGLTEPVPASKLVRDAMPKPVRRAPAMVQCTLDVGRPAPQTPMSWRYKFEDFVTGASNSFAVAAARDLAGSGQVRSLFVTSASGLGKTHLAQAAGQLMLQSVNPLRVMYLTAEQFASRYVAAMRSRELECLKQELCALDALVLEDVHFLQRKTAMQEMILAVIKNLESRGARVIFTSSFTPRQMGDIDPQLTSQFCSGIIANMDRPDGAMRREIIRRKAKIFQVEMPDAVCDIISERLSSDVRQLESCLQSMIFKARLLNSGLTVDLALDTVGQYAGAENSLDMASIVRLVCESFGLTEAQLRSRSRKQEYVQGRCTVFYLARKHTEMSLQSIGDALNRRHSTVVRSITQLEEEMARQSIGGRRIAKAVALIERKCGLQ